MNVVHMNDNNEVQSKLNNNEKNTITTNIQTEILHNEATKKEAKETLNRLLVWTDSRAAEQ